MVVAFLFLCFLVGVLLLFRRKDGGRAGTIWLSLLLVFSWVISTPAAAAVLVYVITPHVPPVMSKADARGATAIVVLGAGMEVYRSRGASYGSPTREGSLRVLEAVRLYRVLGGVPIVASGGNGSAQYSEAGLMAHQLAQLGVPADHVIREDRSTNTRDQAMFVPPLLKHHGIGQFVLVTSQQHIARALAAFRAAGLNPVPSTPEVYVARTGALEGYVPSRVALYISESLVYDLLARVYYKARGWT